MNDPKVAARFVVFLAVVLIPIQSCAQVKDRSSGATVRRYITAVQNKDLKTVVDLTLSYQQDVQEIRGKNPKALWPQLIQEYYDKKTAAFQSQPGYWQDYFESLGAMGGDATKNIRSGKSLLPASTRWKVTETRSDMVMDGWSGRKYRQDTVYVTAEYPVWEDAPIIEGKLLKQTMLEFKVDGTNQLIISSSRVGRADIAREDLFRIVNMTFGNGWKGLTLTFNTVGGKAPFTCDGLVGPTPFAFDCTHPNSSLHSIVFNLSELGEKRQASFRIRIKDSNGRTDEVEFAAPSIPGLARDYCWIREPWYSRNAEQPSDRCIQPINGFRDRDQRESGKVQFDPLPLVAAGFHGKKMKIDKSGKTSSVRFL